MMVVMSLKGEALAEHKREVLYERARRRINDRDRFAQIDTERLLERAANVKVRE